MKKGRKSKYDWNEIKKDHLSGLSLKDLEKKYGVCASWSSQMLRRMGVTPHGCGYRIEVEWRKIVPSGLLKRGLLLSIPRHFINDIGYDDEKDLQGRWRVGEGYLILDLRYNEEIGENVK